MDAMHSARRSRPTARRSARLPALAAAALLLAGGVAASVLAAADDEDEGLGAPPLYDELRRARPEPAGHIGGGSLWVDRFEFAFEEGDLYLIPPVAGRVPIAVFLGRGTVRAWPPDGVEHQQLRKLIEEDYLEEEFERAIFWSTGDLDARLRALAGGAPGREAKKAADLLDDRREANLEQRLFNAESRILMELWPAAAEPPLPAAERPYFFAEIDGEEHDWFSIEVEPRVLEEVGVGQFDRHRKISNTWMSFHALDDFEPETVEPALGRFPRDPEIEGPADPDDDRDDDDDWSFRDYGLLPRLLPPDRELWRPRAAVSRADVDLAIEGNGDAVASVALVVEPLEPLAVMRFRMSPFAEVQDVRWRPGVPARRRRCARHAPARRRCRRDGRSIAWRRCSLRDGHGGGRRRQRDRRGAGRQRERDPGVAGPGHAGRAHGRARPFRPGEARPADGRGPVRAVRHRAAAAAGSRRRAVRAGGGL